MQNFTFPMLPDAYHSDVDVVVFFFLANFKSFEVISEALRHIVTILEIARAHFIILIVFSAFC